MKEKKRKESVRRGRKKGSGSRYSRALADRICTHIRCGDSLRKAAQKEGVPHPTVLKWVEGGGEFRDQYARACEERLNALEDKLLDLCERGHEVSVCEGSGGVMLQAVKLEVDTLKWMLAKLMPKKYGERASVAVEGGERAVEVSHRLPAEAVGAVVSALKEVWLEEEC